MDAGAIWGIVGILITAAFSIWAVNDARKQVDKSIRLQRDIAWLRVQDQLVWQFVEPTDKAQSPEIAKGLHEFAELSKALNPWMTHENLHEAADKEALDFAEKLVRSGYAKWKPDLDRARIQQMLKEWRAEKEATLDQKKRK